MKPHLPASDLTSNGNQHRIEYVPPSTETIRAFARAVCETLAEQTQDARFLQPHVIHGFAHFLEVVARVQAKHMTALQVVDSDEE